MEYWADYSLGKYVLMVRTVLTWAFAQLERLQNR